MIHFFDKLANDVIFSAYEHLHKAMFEWNKQLNALLEDKDNLDDEQKLKFLNVTKMLCYIYINLLLTAEQKEDLSLNVINRGKKKKNADQFNFDYKQILLNINYVMQQDMGVFFDSGVDESFIK